MRRNRPTNAARGFTLYSPSSSTHNTTSESTTEPESTAITSSGSVVSRRYRKTSIISIEQSFRFSRSRRKLRDQRLRSLDTDETPTEHGK
jgi:hypothetical protein